MNQKGATKHISPSNILRVLEQVATGSALTRASIARNLEMSRSTVGLIVDALLEKRILAEEDMTEIARGRPSRQLVPGDGASQVAVVAFGQDASWIGIGDITGLLQRTERLDVSLELGAERGITAAAERLQELSKESGGRPGRIAQAVVSVEAPVDIAAGTLVRSTTPNQGGRYLLGEWEEFPITQRFRHLLSVPVHVDNDANLLALREADQLGPDALPLVRLHLSRGLGAGIVTETGNVYRGGGGTAGDLGHSISTSSGTQMCWCGKSGCIGAVGSLQSITDDLGVDRLRSNTSEEEAEILNRLLKAGDEQATLRVGQAGSALGELAATLVEILNPTTLVLGGELAGVGSTLARIRSGVYERALAMSTRKLNIVTSDGPPWAALEGAAILGSRLMLTLDGVRRQVGLPIKS